MPPLMRAMTLGFATCLLAGCALSGVEPAPAPSPEEAAAAMSSKAAAAAERAESIIASTPAPQETVAPLPENPRTAANLTVDATGLLPRERHTALLTAQLYLNSIQQRDYRVLCLLEVTVHSDTGRLQAVGETITSCAQSYQENPPNPALKNELFDLEDLNLSDEEAGFATVTDTRGTQLLRVVKASNGQFYVDTSAAAAAPSSAHAV